MRKGDFIITYKSIEFWPLDPRESEVHIVDIAHALGMLCRFNGHLNSFYSVCEHCIRVSYLVAPKLALAGLLHDATEAYLSDIPSPTKIDLPIYKEWENVLQATIYSKFGLPIGEPPEVKLADRIMLVSEMRDLLPSGLMPNWEIAKKGYVPLRKRIGRTMSPRTAKRLYLTRFKELTGQKLNILEKIESKIMKHRFSETIEEFTARKIEFDKLANEDKVWQKQY